MLSVGVLLGNRMLVCGYVGPFARKQVVGVKPTTFVRVRILFGTPTFGEYIMAGLIKEDIELMQRRLLRALDKMFEGIETFAVPAEEAMALAKLSDALISLDKHIAEYGDD